MTVRAAPTQLSVEQRERFLKLVGEGVPARTAASLVGVHRQRLYEARRDPEFAAAWRRASESGARAIEEERRQRVDGNGRPTIRSRRPATAAERETVARQVACQALRLLSLRPDLARRQVVDALIAAQEGEEALFERRRRRTRDPVYRSARERTERALERGAELLGNPPALERL